ncbi:hypothetical protein V2J09_016516 [Rumex salicifolius]
MPVDASEQVQDFCSILVITDEGRGNGQCEPPLGLSNSLAVQSNHLCMDVQGTGHNPYDLGKETAATYCPCHITVDMENNNLDKAKVHDETGGSIKNEIALTKPLRRQNSLQPGGEPIQPFMNHILMLLDLDAKDKQTTERANDVPNNKWRKYKRPAAFDSRQIVKYGNHRAYLFDTESSSSWGRLCAHLICLSSSSSWLFIRLEKWRWRDCGEWQRIETGLVTINNPKAELVERVRDWEPRDRSCRRRTNLEGMEINGDEHSERFMKLILKLNKCEMHDCRLHIVASLSNVVHISSGGLLRIENRKRFIGNNRFSRILLGNPVSYHNIKTIPGLKDENKENLAKKS